MLVDVGLTSSLLVWTWVEWCRNVETLSVVTGCALIVL